MHGVVVHVCHDLCFRATKFFSFWVLMLPAWAMMGSWISQSFRGGEGALPHSFWNKWETPPSLTVSKPMYYQNEKDCRINQEKQVYSASSCGSAAVRRGWPQDKGQLDPCGVDEGWWGWNTRDICRIVSSTGCLILELSNWKKKGK